MNEAAGFQWAEVGKEVDDLGRPSWMGRRLITGWVTGLAAILVAILAAILDAILETILAAILDGRFVYFLIEVRRFTYQFLSF